jgi:hypothetical protein
MVGANAGESAKQTTTLKFDSKKKLRRGFLGIKIFTSGFQKRHTEPTTPQANKSSPTVNHSIHTT